MSELDLMKSKLKNVLKHYGCVENETGNWQCSKHDSKGKHSLSITEEVCCCVSPGCELKGDVFDVIAVYEGFDIRKDFSKVIKKCSEITGIPQPSMTQEEKERLTFEIKRKIIIKRANSIFFEECKKYINKVENYIEEKRKIKLERLNLGFLPEKEWIQIKTKLLQIPEIKDIKYTDKEGKEHLFINTYFSLVNRIIHPHFYNKEIIYFTGEVTPFCSDITNKYIKLNSKFALNYNAEGYMLDSIHFESNTLFICEGYWDCIAMIDAGMAAVTFGTCKISNYFIETYWKELQKFKIITCFDTEENESGIEGAKAFNRRLYEKDIENIYIAQLPVIDKEKIDIDMFLQKFKTKEEKQKAIDDYLINNAKHFKTFIAQDMGIKTLDNIFEEGIPKIEWLVDNIIPKRGVTIFGGKSGSLKTWSAQQLAMALATNTKFLNFFETNKKCIVLYIDEENGEVTLPYRFGMLNKGHGNHKYNNIYISFFNDMKFDDPKKLKNLMMLIDTIKPDVIILDSVVRAMVGNENDSKDVRKIFENLKVMFKIKGDISFILLHHTTKTGNNGFDGLRGSGDFAAFCDIIYMFNNKNTGLVNVKTAKNRHIDLQKFPGFNIRVESTEDSMLLEKFGDLKDTDAISRAEYDYDGWVEDENIQHWKTQGMFKALSSLGHSKNTLHDLRKKLLEDGKIKKISHGKYEVI